MNLWHWLGQIFCISLESCLLPLLPLLSCSHYRPPTHWYTASHDDSTTFPNGPKAIFESFRNLMFLNKHDVSLERYSAQMSVALYCTNIFSTLSVFDELWHTVEFQFLNPDTTLTWPLSYEIWTACRFSILVSLSWLYNEGPGHFEFLYFPLNKNGNYHATNLFRKFTEILKYAFTENIHLLTLLNLVKNNTMYVYRCMYNKNGCALYRHARALPEVDTVYMHMHTPRDYFSLCDWKLLSSP